MKDTEKKNNYVEIGSIWADLESGAFIFNSTTDPRVNSQMILNILHSTIITFGKYNNSPRFLFDNGQGIVVLNFSPNQVH